MKFKSFICQKSIPLILLVALVLTVFTGCTQADGKAVTTIINDDMEEVEVITEEMIIIHFGFPDNIDDTKDVKDNMIAVGFASTDYRIFPIPVFETSTSEGTIVVENVATNKYTQAVEIYTKDDNTLIYSKELPVGEKVEKDKLLVGLPKGEYNCEAHIRNIDPETGEKIGGAVFDIKLTVLN